MKKALTFDDVLIEPKFSDVLSRKHTDLSQKLGKYDLILPIISANMDTITEESMANALTEVGAIGCLHRFSTIEENIAMYKSCVDGRAIVSFGASIDEQVRVDGLYEAGARVFCLDVAHGAQAAIVDQVKWFKKLYDDAFLIVGNFGSEDSFREFIDRLDQKKYFPEYIKVGIGPGSACITRVQTGCGYPQLSAIKELSLVAGRYGIKTIADGGMRTPGDIAKALAAGASVVMLGGMLSGTEETPVHGVYRGSASRDAYRDQGKDWSTAEGESFKVEAKGHVQDVIKNIEGGLRSSLTYVGAKNLQEFKDKAEFIQVSGATIMENMAHGKLK